MSDRQRKAREALLARVLDELKHVQEHGRHTTLCLLYDVAISLGYEPVIDKPDAETIEWARKAFAEYEAGREKVG